MRDVRCAMVNFDPDSGSPAPEVLKTVVHAHQNTAGNLRHSHADRATGRRTDHRSSPVTISVAVDRRALSGGARKSRRSRYW
jgi:hypothetical protein